MGLTATALQRAEGDLAVFFYLTIGGIPYYFSTVEAPTAWSLGSYTWSQTFTLFRDGEGEGIHSEEQAIDPTTGVIKSGAVDLEFQMDPESQSGVWFDYLLPTTRNEYYLDAEVTTAPSSRIIGFTTDVTALGTPLATGNDYFIGVETLQFGSFVSGGTRGDTIEVATGDSLRGLYGSARQWYGPRGPTQEHMGGPTVLSDWPKVWRKREVKVYMAAATVMADGTLQPLASSPASSDDEQIFRGHIYDYRLAPDHTSVVFSCQSLVQELERSALTRLRSYDLGPELSGEASGWVYIEQTGPRYLEVNAGADSSFTTLDAEWDLYTLLGEGLYHWTSITAELNNHANRPFIEPVTLQFLDFTFTIHYREDGEQFLKVGVRYYSVALARWYYIKDTVVFHKRNHPHQSILPALGVEGDLEVQPAAVGSVGASAAFSWAIHDKPIPFYTVGVNSSRVYYRGVTNPNTLTGDPPQAQSTTQIDGRIDHTFARIGDTEIVEGDFWDPDSGLPYQSGASNRYFKIATNYGSLRRGLFNTPPMDTSTPRMTAESANTQMVVGLGFEKTKALYALLWMAISNGDHDTPLGAAGLPSEWNQLPDGFGCGISPDLFNLDKFFAVAASTSEAILRNLWLEDPVEIREWFKRIGIASGTTFIQQANDDGDLQITPIKITRQIAADSVMTIDDDHTDSMESPVEADRSERRIWNVVKAQYGWDQVAGKFKAKAVFNEHASIEEYGAASVVNLKLPWVPVSRLRSDIKPVVERLFAAYGRPFPTFKVSDYNPASLTLQVGQTVLFTHPYVPNFREGGLGLTDEPCQILSMSREINPANQTPFSELTLIWRNADGRRFTRYVPCLRVLSLSAGTTYNIAEDRDEGGFSVPDVSDDYEHFAATYIVRAYLPYTDDAFEIRTVTSISATQIVLNAAITLTPLADVVIEFADYDNGSGPLHDDQEDGYTFMCINDVFTLTDTGSEVKDGVRWG